MNGAAGGTNEHNYGSAHASDHEHAADVAQPSELDALVDRLWEPLRHNDAANRLFYAASNAGEFGLIWHLLGAVRALSPRRSALDAVRFSALIALESLLVNQGIKRFFNRTRPGSAADNTTPHQLRQPITSSFPSGHASGAFCAAAVLAAGSRIGPAYRVAAAIVAASRIHVRLHHASDVLAGAIIGEAVGRAAARLMRR